ncbi:hypothetical protein DB346_00525 [Verrucomicrobia bacterium LW23]|nr:hypothetical protein DB346_00525 [Verrucomicrobia bacterium LW23]
MDSLFRMLQYGFIAFVACLFPYLFSIGPVSMYYELACQFRDSNGKAIRFYTERSTSKWAAATATGKPIAKSDVVNSIYYPLLWASLQSDFTRHILFTYLNMWSTRTKFAGGPGDRTALACC